MKGLAARRNTDLQGEQNTLLSGSQCFRQGGPIKQLGAACPVGCSSKGCISVGHGAPGQQSVCPPTALSLAAPCTLPLHHTFHPPRPPHYTTCPPPQLYFIHSLLPSPAATCALVSPSHCTMHPRLHSAARGKPDGVAARAM